MKTKTSRQYDALKSSTKVELLEVIRAALDCQSHFHKPTIVNNDPVVNLGDTAIVICASCVDRMRKVLCLKTGEDVPTYFQFEHWKRVRNKV